MWMRLPILRYSAPATRQQVLQFNGVRYGPGGGDGDLAESLNLSSRLYPALGQRLGREAVGGYTAPTAVYARDKLCVVDGTDLLYDGKRVGTVTAGEKRVAAVNSKILVFPDKVYYDVEKGEFGPMARSVVLAHGGLTFTDDALEVSENPVEGKTLADLFAANQAIEITGCSIQANNKSIIVRGVQGNKLTFYEHSFTAGSSDADVTLERKVPDLAYICESGNRLWGVEENTIWASALGDPLTFYNYDGLSTDSFAVAVGSEGEFTGCCAYSSNVLFFKETCLHKLLGSEPSEYRIYTYNVPGVQAGSGESLQVVNEVLYYKGAAGVYAYTGGAPTLASENFGPRRFGSARAGTDGLNYYISMEDLDSGAWGLYVFDTLRGVWLREDDSHALGFARLNGELHFLSGDGKLYKMNREGLEEKLRWEALLAPFDWTLPERKQYVRLYIQAELEEGGWLRVEVREDGKPWKQAALHHADRRKNFAVPVAPCRCDTLQLRLSGEGRCLVRQVTREFVVGGSR